ncbi:DUF2956 domain-containing protein [Vibrio ostreicida]|uniref:DUF2956 domain-containing protein n=1 Tax=Vibrio ostreicida TaxID=526588 RepID=A0ABT8C1T8_9VIBR|nr:DUF2956 domain-containing protein [Vibrio ostreicida]MDN3612325.1 DUF2956 domain-containing protein [Vibrio ostreicida]NPD08706.1 DUF2956 domain-containing protein [Vibrio ostreicida]
MAPKNTPHPSAETINEATQIARATQKPGQTKQQTKLIAQGIEQGIAQYKKQHKAQARAANKAKKQLLKQNANREQAAQTESLNAEQSHHQPFSQRRYLPWVLLALSWVFFVSYLVVF